MTPRWVLPVVDFTGWGHPIAAFWTWREIILRCLLPVSCLHQKSDYLLISSRKVSEDL